MQATSLPVQLNHYDCGVYTAAFADAVCFDPDRHLCSTAAAPKAQGDASLPPSPGHCLSEGDIIVYRILAGAAMLGLWRRHTNALCTPQNTSKDEADKILSDVGWFFSANPPLFRGRSETDLGCVTAIVQSVPTTPFCSHAYADQPGLLHSFAWYRSQTETFLLDVAGYYSGHPFGNLFGIN